MTDTPIQRFLDALYRETGEKAKPSGNGWSARCPAHDDRTPSLSVAEGDNGGVVVICRAGCPTKKVVAAIGLSMVDLMPADGVDADTNRPRPRKTGIVSPSAPGNSARRTFPAARTAIAQLEKQHGKPSKMWVYHNAKREPAGVIVRWDRPEGKKDIRPVSRNGDGWVIGGMPEPRPLYRLPDLAGAERVLVVEGEKCVEAARSVGLVATTSPHGSKSAAKADWSPLAGKQVVILPDNNQAGQDYADAVAAILAKLTPTPVVKVIDLPGLPEGGDVVDWIDAHGDAAEPDELRRQVEALADAAEPIQPERPAPAILPWRPYPIHALPMALRRYVAAVAAAMRTDPVCPALAALVTASACVGTARAVRLKRRWIEPPTIWGVVVAEQGSGKSPPMREAVRPLIAHQRRELEIYKERLQDYQRDMAHHEKAMNEWRRAKTDGDPPEAPERPAAVRHVVSDTTLEGLAPILGENPRGVLLDADELTGWLGGMDRYTRGHQADAAAWRRIFDSHAITIDRKTGRQLIHVPRPFVSIVGTVQPGVLRRALGVEHLESGLAARLLLAYPAARPIEWSDADIPEAIESRYEKVLKALLALEHETDAKGQPGPKLVTLHPEARKRFVVWHDRHRAEQADLHGVLSGHSSKLVAYAARLALLIHLVRQADGEPVGGEIDVESMESAISLVEWHKREAGRVYAVLAETDEEGDRRELAELIQRKGGSVTPRDLMRASRRFPRAEDAEQALDDLFKAGIGRWEPVDHGGGRGRPTRRFVVFDAVDVDRNSVKPEENPICVGVDGVNERASANRVNDLLDEAAAEDSAGWGEI